MPQLSVAQRGKIRRLSQPKELAPDEEGGELNIVPFLDIIVNILIFVLATVVTTFTSTIETNPPAGRGGVRASVPKEALNLTVLIVNDGFSLKSSGGSVGAGCAGIGQGLSVANRGAKYDYASLTKCAAKLKGANPAFAEENQVGIGANPGIPYGVVIKTMDALRTTHDGKGPLFENVNFKVSK